MNTYNLTYSTETKDRFHNHGVNKIAIDAENEETAIAMLMHIYTFMDVGTFYKLGRIHSAEEIKTDIDGTIQFKSWIEIKKHFKIRSNDEACYSDSS